MTSSSHPVRQWRRRLTWDMVFPLQILTALDRDGYCRKHKLRHKLEQAINLMSGSSWEEEMDRWTDGSMGGWGRRSRGGGSRGVLFFWTVWTVSWAAPGWIELTATAPVLSNQSISNLFVIGLIDWFEGRLAGPTPTTSVWWVLGQKTSFQTDLEKFTTWLQCGIGWSHFVETKKPWCITWFGFKSAEGVRRDCGRTWTLKTEAVLTKPGMRCQD